MPTIMADHVIRGLVLGGIVDSSTGGAMLKGKDVVWTTRRLRLRIACMGGTYGYGSNRHALHA